MSGDEIVWEDPPPKEASGKHNGSNIRRIAALRTHPGKWARFDGFLSGSRASSHAQALKNLGAEARSHSDVEAGIYCVYARWPEDAA